MKKYFIFYFSLVLDCRSTTNAYLVKDVSKYSPSIYFKQEPENIYVIESYSSRQYSSNIVNNKTMLILDCGAVSQNTNELPNVKWIKDNVEFNFQTYSSESNKEFEA